MNRCISILFFIGSLYCTCLNALSKTVLISIPKCGTHLLIKCLERLSGAKFDFTGHHLNAQGLDNRLRQLRSDRFLVAHLPFSQSSLQKILKYNARALFIYRDPRDQLISFSHYIMQNNCSVHPKQAWPMAQYMSIEEVKNSLLHDVLLYHWWPGNAGVAQFYRSFMPWINVHSNVSVFIIAIR